MKLHSVRFKISILYTAVLGLILLAYSSLLYFNLSYIVYHEIDKNLKTKAAEIESIINSYSRVFEADQEHTPVSLKRTLHLDEAERDEFFQWPSIKRLDQAWKTRVQALGIKQDYIVIYYPSGEIIEKSSNVEDAQLAVLENNFKGVSLKTSGIKSSLSPKDLPLRIISRPFWRWGKIKYVIQLATPLEPSLFILRSKIRLILVSIPIFLLLASFLGRFFVLRIFQPILEITQTARMISYKDMSKRVGLRHADEEIISLVDGFNDMICRLERSFKYIEEFSSNVSHELKTPLAIIRGELEVALLKKDARIEEYRRAMGVVLEETQRMLKIINDLLLLSKLDYRTEAFAFEPVDLIDFLSELGEQARALASTKDILVSLHKPQGDLRINANPLHLRRLFLNLVDNAVKFTPTGGRIDITAASEDGCAVVSVSDTGAGIAEADLERIFDRFFRVDRTDEALSSSGLGLSIVQTIAKIHHGSVEVKSQLGQGCVFTTRLPLAVEV